MQLLTFLFSFWCVLDLSMSAPKIYSNFTFAFDYQIETRWRWRCWCWCQFWSDAIRYDSRFVFVYLCCQTTTFLVFLFSFFSFCFPILFCLFSCCCDFLLLLSSLPSLCVFYFHFLRNFIYFAVAAVAILHFALAQLPLSASAPALLDHSFSISLYRPRSPALSCSLAPFPPPRFLQLPLVCILQIELTPAFAFAGRELGQRQRRVVQVPALQMSTHAARYTIRSCTP